MIVHIATLVRNGTRSKYNRNIVLPKLQPLGDYMEAKQRITGKPCFLRSFGPGTRIKAHGIHRYAVTLSGAFIRLWPLRSWGGKSMRRRTIADRRADRAARDLNLAAK